MDEGPTAGSSNMVSQASTMFPVSTTWPVL